MNDLTLALESTAAGMRAQAQRLRHISENIANADTPGYQRKTIPFLTDDSTGQITAGPVHLDTSSSPQIYDPGHPLADAAGYYAGSNVNMVVEIADSREAQRSYEANLQLFDQARQMLQSLMQSLQR